MTAALKRTIFVGCRDLGIDHDARRDLQLRVTGKASLTDMSESDLRAVVGALKESGFKPRSTGRKHPPAPRADLRLIHVLWRKLGEAGVLRDGSRMGLNAFVRKRFGASFGAELIDIDAMRDAGQIATVIDALVSWCDREDVALDEDHIRPGRRAVRKKTSN